MSLGWPCAAKHCIWLFQEYVTFQNTRGRCYETPTIKVHRSLKGRGGMTISKLEKLKMSPATKIIEKQIRAPVFLLGQIQTGMDVWTRIWLNTGHVGTKARAKNIKWLK